MASWETNRDELSEAAVRGAPSCRNSREETMKLRAATGLLALFAAPALAQSRLPTIPPSDYTDEQKQAAQDFEAARKTPVFGPFEPLMHSPKVMSLARAMGDYLRYNSAIGNRSSEFVILVIAREWSQDYEWTVHYPIALKAGIGKEIADAIAGGRRPAGMSEQEETIYDFLTELLRNKSVSEPTYARAEKLFGKKGVVDLTAIAGYYTFLAMEMNVARYAGPPGGLKLPRLPE
jgi:4-carboxymuconolactone decarboxylase